MGIFRLDLEERGEFQNSSIFIGGRRPLPARGSGKGQEGKGPERNDEDNGSGSDNENASQTDMTVSGLFVRRLMAKAVCKQSGTGHHH